MPPPAWACLALPSKGCYGLLNGSWSLRFECDFTEGGFILRNILIEHVGQGLGLLWAQVDSFKILNRDRVGSGLVHGSVEQKEVPQAHAHLHAVSIVFAVIGGVHQLDLGLRLLRIHMRSG